MNSGGRGSHARPGPTHDASRGARADRRLAAILSADVAGYAKLMGADEASTVERLKGCRERIDAVVGRHGGRVIDAVGDAILAEAPSVVAAVSCALAIQEEVADLSADATEERKMRFRIGCHLGDVIVDGDTIYGDGVIVAARVMTHAEPGGVALSASAFDQVEGKLGLVFEDLGTQSLKNVARPQRIFRVIGPQSEGDVDVLERALGAISDATPIDWDDLLARAPAQAEDLRRIQRLQQVAHSLRGGERADPIGPEGGSGWDASPAEPALFVWGQLRVLEKLGEGAFGEIYRAFDPVLRREVALKLDRPSEPADPAVSSSRSREALEEARRLARIRHPHVLAVHGADIREGRVGIWTDLLRGRTLEERLASGGILPSQQVALIGVDLCRALSAVHGAGLVHGDVKASNVMQEAGGGVVLVDFGSGRELAAPAPATGTPLALAPELLRGEPATPASDLYALGALLFRLCAGRHPVEARSVPELIAKHEAGARPEIREARPDLPLPLARCIERALAPSEERFATAAEMEQSLADVLLALGSPEEPAKSGAREGPTNLRAPLTRFVGREQEQRELAELLSRERLVTLTGAGGSGKTRLAIHVAGQLRSRFPDGVWFVDLSGVEDPREVVGSVATAIGFKGPEGLSLEDALVAYLARREALLVLDNCEQLRGGAAAFATDLVGRGERIQLLATSRDQLGATGETLLRLAPLALPPEQVASASELATVDSVALFVDRAQQANSSFALDGATAPDVARICRRLDGIPLALELAAARVRMLDVEDIARRLDSHFALLDARGGDRPDRQQTLDALIGWSHRLLPAAERALFRRLAVFAGGWTLEAAEEVCGFEGIDDADVVGLLANLVGKSLVERDGRARYRFLETVRQFATVKLEAEDALPAEAARLHARHLDYFAGLASAAQPHLGMFVADEETWRRRFDPENENLRTAMAWSRHSEGAAQAGLGLAATLHWFWAARGQFGEGRRWLGELLAAGGQAAPAVRAQALVSLGYLANWQGDLTASQEPLEQARVLYRELPDEAGEAFCLRGLAASALARGDESGAMELLEQALQLARHAEDEILVGFLLHSLATGLAYQGSFARASDLFRECIERFADAGVGSAFAHFQLGRMARFGGDHEESRAQGLAALRLFDGLQDRRGTAIVLSGLASLEVQRGELRRAAQLLGAVSSLVSELGVRFDPVLQAEHDEACAAAERGLGEEAFELAWEKGRSMTLEQVVSREWSDPGVSASSGGSSELSTSA